MNSPVLANIYLHHLLDEWWSETVLARLRGRAFLVRYADDGVPRGHVKEAKMAA